MKLKKKHLGLVLASFIALSFNSHFAQAAKKTQELLQPSKVYAFKRVGNNLTPLSEVSEGPVLVKKTGIRIDRNNVYIGGYLVNTSDKPVTQVRIFPSFLRLPTNAIHLSDRMNHDELNLSPKETRRFVIMRPIADLKSLLEFNVPIHDNCVLNCRVL